jgi:hypothetical protein
MTGRGPLSIRVPAVSVLPERMTDHANPRIARVRLRESVETRRTLGVAYLASQRNHVALQRMIDAAHRYAARNDTPADAACTAARPRRSINETLPFTALH